MAISKTLDVNGARITTSFDDPDMPLLYLLRDNLGVHGPRFGCGLAQCGACTVHIDGRAARSCVTAVSSISDNNKIVTLEGLGTPEKPHPVQRAFIEEQAVQCGYCINGMIMQSAAFLVTNPRPSRRRSRTRCSTRRGFVCVPCRSLMTSVVRQLLFMQQNQRV
jgi:nicotinate dehydrogenase subunit A